MHPLHQSLQTACHPCPSLDRPSPSSLRAQLDREIEIHGRLTHPNIAQLHEVFEDDRAVYMVQEFVTGGDLYTDLMTNGKFDEYRAAGVVIAPMLQALRYIHGRASAGQGRAGSCSRKSAMV